MARGNRGTRNNYPSRDDGLATIRRLGTVTAAATHYSIPVNSFKDWLRREGMTEDAKKAMLAAAGKLAEVPPDPAELIAESVHEFLRKQKRNARLNIYDAADSLDLPPQRIRDALELLRSRGIRIPEEEEDQGNIALQRINPENRDGALHKSLLEGDQVTVGLVSDTHLSSNEEALEELHAAYDFFEDNGIIEVWHPGDLVCGRGIFRTQDAEIKNHTFETQVDHAVANYPVREGIKTLAIGGNHDLEGEFGRIGADPVQAVANQRPDIENLGPYSAWIELPGGSFAHLLHGRGGMSYAYSYKAQKLVDGYAPGRKPAVLCVGHWHVSGWLHQRGVNVVFPGCFEWRSPFLERLGLSPAVGFWVLDMKIADDGSVVQFAPRWHQFHEGRVHAAA